MNKEEDYRNLAGNITEFTDNTCYYEDWLVIQQYVDDWLDEIDRLNNVINELEDFVKDEYRNPSEQDLEWEVGLILDKLIELRSED